MISPEAPILVAWQAVFSRLIISLFAFSCFCMNPTSPTGDETPQVYLRRLAAGKSFPGIQYIVTDRNGIIFEFNGGMADLQKSRPVTCDTTFMLSSTTKTFTAAAIMKLSARGKINVDEPLSRYYPHHPYGDKLTIRQLLNQTSGIPNPPPIDWLHLARQHDSYDEEQTLRAVLSKYSKPDFPPGEKYAYSNISYWLLGKVIESVSGKKYCSYLRSEIFRPLGIRREELDCTPIPPDRQAQGYYRSRSLWGILIAFTVPNRFLGGVTGPYRQIRPVYMNGPPYGGLRGNARGIARFLRDMLQEKPKLFDSKTRDQFLEMQHDGRGREIETTLGWHHGVLDGRKWYGKPGGGPGFHSDMRIYPREGIGTVYLINEFSASESRINEFSDSLDRFFLSDR